MITPFSSVTSTVTSPPKPRADALNVPIHIAEQPVYSVALGLGKILEMPQDKNRLSITVEKQGV